MIYDMVDSWWFSNIFTFAKHFEAEADIKRIYGKALEDWDYEDADMEVIGEVLKERDGFYFITYDEEHDGINIYKLEVA